MTNKNRLERQNQNRSNRVLNQTFNLEARNILSVNNLIFPTVYNSCDIGLIQDSFMLSRTNLIFKFLFELRLNLVMLAFYAYIFFHSVFILGTFEK